MGTINSHPPVQSGQQYLYLDHVLNQAVYKLNIDAIAVYVSNSSGSVNFLQGKGFNVQEIEFALANPAAKKVRRNIISGQRSITHEIKIGERRRLETPKSPNSSNPFTTCQAVPLISSGETKGIIEAYSKNPRDNCSAYGNTFNLIAQSIISTIDNRDYSNHFSPSLGANPPKHSAILDALMAAMLLRSGEIESHARRVTDMTLHLAKTLGLADDQLAHLVRGAMLHDIGKLSIPDSILQKPGPLTSTEWDLMRKHPEFAFKLLSPISSLKPALPIPYSHHERWDGAGYPLGLKHEAIPLPARIFSIVDVWDALRSDRPYRKAWSDKDVHSHILKQTGKQFDPNITRVFLDLI